MELYSAIPEIAARCGCTYDSVLLLVAIHLLLFLVVVSITVFLLIDVGQHLYKYSKEGYVLLWRKLKKK